MAGKLYIVGTPIGNLGDLSPRALETLAQCDFIAAEDTRVTGGLLTHFGLRKPMISYFEHNQRERGEEILTRLLGGATAALVTDAGMPAVSDPGQALVALCAQNGIAVEAVPGPTALTTALSVAGMPCGRFTFEGFLSVNKRSRREHLAELVHEKRTMVFYEAPHKLAATLTDLLESLGDRPLSLARELTKLHEEIIRTTLAKAVALYDTQAPRGEFVLVVGGDTRAPQAVPLDEAIEAARAYRESGLSPSAAAGRAATETGRKKGEIYKALTEEQKNTL